MLNNKKTHWVLLAPIIITMITLVFYPIIRTFIFSLYKYKLTEPGDLNFVNIANYIKVLTSKDFFSALKNSAIMLIITLFVSLFSSLAIGLMLNKNSKISPLLTGVAILPWALPPIVNGIIWTFIFNSGYGLLNKLLIGLKIVDSPISWTTGRLSLLIVVSIVVAWRVVPFCAIIILSNLKTIPKELYEAAKVDGSTSIQSFFYITLPLLIPSLSIVLVQITMASINTFDEIVAISGYRFESQNLILYNYFNTFSYLDFGYGSAITYVIMIFSGILGFFYIKNMTLDLKGERKR